MSDNPVMTQKNPAILSFTLALVICFLMTLQPAKANSFMSEYTPGMLFANMVFKIGADEGDRILTPSQIRFEIMNSKGAELAYIKSSLEDDNTIAGFTYGFKDTYKRPDDYPRSRENFILDEPQTYQAALARYKRSVYLYKSSVSANEKRLAGDYMKYCYQLALAHYNKEFSDKKNGN